MAATRILPGGAIIDGVSMAANITSDTLDVQGAGVVGLQLIAASGTHVGTFAVELSVDGSNWDATGFRISAGTTATTVAAANGVALAELVLVDVGAARHLRVTYTFTSGAGTAYVYAVRKRLAAGVTNGTATVTSAQLPASLGIKAAAASLSVTQATEDAARMPASLGSKADAASLPVTQSTEDKAVLAAMSAKLPASLGVKAAAASLSVTQSTEDAAKVPALGVAASAASSPVVLASDDAHLGAVGAASDVDGNLHGQLRYIGDYVDNIPAQGAANASASLPVTVATDDAHYGAVGAASDVDGVVHGQLRYIGEAANTISADLDDVQSGTFFDCSTAGGSRTFTDTTAKTSGLAAGLYAVSATQTCHIKTGPNASVEAAVGACTRLPADTVIGVVIDGTNDAIAAIREAVSGTLYYSKVG